MVLLGGRVTQAVEYLQQLARLDVGERLSLELQVALEEAGKVPQRAWSVLPCAVREKFLFGVIERHVCRPLLAEMFLVEDAPRFLARPGQRQKWVSADAVAPAGANEDDDPPAEASAQISC